MSYLLTCKAAEKLYSAAKDLPILDYHCHLVPKEIFEDKVFSNIGEMWLVPKNNDTLSPADTARYIYEAIQNNQAVSVPFGWLGTVGNYVNVLHECSNISSGEYYLAWKAVTDNTSPMIRAVKIADVTI